MMQSTTKTPFQTIITSFSKHNNNAIDNDTNDYILHMTKNNIKNISVATSNKKISTYNIETQQLLKNINNVHECQITDLVSDKNNLLYSCSEDGCVKGWDLTRSDDKPTCNIKVPIKGEEALNISLGYDNTLLSVGTSKGSIHFYDIRNSTTPLLGSYTDVSIQEINQLHFITPSILLSGSEDGLISIHDTSKSSEDDAVQGIMNINSSIRTIGTFGPNDYGIYCLSGTETLSLWYYPTTQLLYDFGDIRRYNDMSYGIGCYSSTTNNQDDLLFLGGDYNGTIFINKIQPPSDSNQYNMNLFHKLQNGHNACVRTFLNVDDNDVWVTGGEDSRLCIWKLNDSCVSLSGNQYNSPNACGPIRTQKRKKKSSHSPY